MMAFMAKNQISIMATLVYITIEIVLNDTLLWSHVLLCVVYYLFYVIIVVLILIRIHTSNL